MNNAPRCSFIPPYLLHRIASEHVDPSIARCGHATLAVDEALRARRLAPPPVVGEAEQAFVVAEEDAWTVHTARNTRTLPGTPVRSAGEPPSGDAAVDEAYAGIEATVALFAEGYRRDSYDGRGAPVIATVHYARNYDNAFWDGRQLVFGDGDGRVFDRFTKPVDVLAHEFVHAVTQYAAGFSYQGQSGALNESMSDAFAACVKQRLLGQAAAEGDWLVGEGIFLPGVNARGLRSMAEPGTAYDDPVIGTDPQVGHMSQYVETREDNGGVHLNSGIPNRAFHLAATRIGGTSWEGAGRIWYDALTGPGVGPDTDFATFAQATVDVSPDDASRAAVAEAWEQVGVPVSVAVPVGASGAAVPVAAAMGGGGASATGGGSGGGEPAGSGGGGSAGSGGGEPAGSGSGEPAGRPDAGILVKVTRSGGFAGREVSGEVATAKDDADPRAEEVGALLDRIDLAAVEASEPQPDRFEYTFYIRGDEIRVHEQDLTPELARLASIVLGE